jgi:hypothetical protein
MHLIKNKKLKSNLKLHKMKKLSLLLFVVFFLTTIGFGQESTFNKGDKVVNVGIGFGTTFYHGLYYKTSVPPVSISGEYGFKDGILDKGVIGLGGYIGYSANKWEYTGFGYDYGTKYKNFILAARGVFHYPFIDKLDTYTGLMVGFRLQTQHDFGDWNTGGVSNTAAGSGPVFSWFAGARYYFTEKFAGMAEIGYGISYLNLGVAIKL